MYGEVPAGGSPGVTQPVLDPTDGVQRTETIERDWGQDIPEQHPTSLFDENSSPPLRWIHVAKYVAGNVLQDDVKTGTSFASEMERSSPVSDCSCTVKPSSVLGEESDARIMRIYRRAVWLTLGVDHPEPLAESESLASVNLPAIDPAFELLLPLEVVEKKSISNPQLECCIYAARSFSLTLPGCVRGGYFLGEGTGCGKGRIIAASIWHLWNQGHRRHLWVSVGRDLIVDAMRDLRDIGAEHIPVVDLNTLPLSDLDSPAGLSEFTQRAARVNPLWEWTQGEGVLFATYSLLARSIQRESLESCLQNVGSSFSQMSDMPCLVQRPALRSSPSTSKTQCSPNTVGLSKNVSPPDTPQPKPGKASFPVVTRLGQVIQWMSQSLPASAASKKRKLEVLTRGKIKSEDWKMQYWKWIPEQRFPGGLICFDEAHKAKNLVVPALDFQGVSKGTASGQVVQKLQDFLPHCPVLYASATGATELKHMGYMTRLGLWSPYSAFPNFPAFREAVERGGVAAMECVAMDLKSAGLYSCRTLSFSDVVVKTWTVTSSPAWTNAYNAIASLITRIYAVIQRTTPDDSGSRSSRLARGGGAALLRSSFWGTQQRIFKQLLVSQKVDATVALTESALARGSQVVLSLWVTGESRTNEKLKMLRHKAAKRLCKSDDSSWGSSITPECEDQLDDFLSPPKLMLEQFIKERLPGIGVSSDEIVALLTTLDSIVFPNNPLDDLIDKLGGPSRVAELSGRTKRLVWDTTSTFLRYVPRDSGGVLDSSSPASLTSVNLREQKLFQSGKKKVAIITEAASAGISLHSDASIPHVAPREMICLESPWAADKAVQQLGRIHRSNQRYPPHYHILVSDIGGERRFVACITKRLRTLGAITRGDRRAGTLFNLNASELATYSCDEKCDDVTAVQPDNGVKGSSDSSARSFSSSLSSDFDVYSKLGYEARVLLLTWLAHHTNAPEATRLPNEVPTPSCCLECPSRYASCADFAFQIARLFRECGVFDASSQSFKLGSEKHRAKEMDRFLNRLLLLPIEQQNDVLAFFFQIYSTLVETSRFHGLTDDDYSVESLNIQSGIRHPLAVVDHEVFWIDPVSHAETVCHHLTLDRGISWATAEQLLRAMATDAAVDGFYWMPSLMRSSENNTQCVALVLRRPQLNTVLAPHVLVYRPHIGVGATSSDRRRITTLASILQHGWTKVLEQDTEKAQRSWTQQFMMAATDCLHSQLHGCCAAGEQCRVGRRFQHIYLLSGNLIHLWSRLERWFHRDTDSNHTAVTQDDLGSPPSTSAKQTPRFFVQPNRLEPSPFKSRLRLVRATLPNRQALIGALIPPQKLGVLKRNLKNYSITPENPAAALTRKLTSTLARIQVYQEKLYFKLLKFVMNAVTEYSLHHATNAALTVDNVYAVTMEAFDRQPALTLWSSDELQCINAAFPASSSELDHFDTFLAVGNESIGVFRSHDPQTMRALYRFRPDLLCVNTILSSSTWKPILARQMERYLYQYQYLVSRQQTLNTTNEPIAAVKTNNNCSPLSSAPSPFQLQFECPPTAALKNLCTSTRAPPLFYATTRDRQSVPVPNVVSSAPWLHPESSRKRQEAPEIIDLDEDSEEAEHFPKRLSSSEPALLAPHPSMPPKTFKALERLRLQDTPQTFPAGSGDLPAAELAVTRSSCYTTQLNAYGETRQLSVTDDEKRLHEQMDDVFRAIHREPTSSVAPTFSTLGDADGVVHDRDPLFRAIETAPLARSSAVTAAMDRLLQRRRMQLMQQDQKTECTQSPSRSTPSAIESNSGSSVKLKVPQTPNPAQNRDKFFQKTIVDVATPRTTSAFKPGSALPDQTPIVLDLDSSTDEDTMLL